MVFSLFPKTLYKTNSDISGQIEVTQWLDKRTLSVQKMIQSGGMVEVIWKKPIGWIRDQKLNVKNVLILGLGGGTVVGMIDRFWTGAKITGIELDPVVVRIGKDFFGLDDFRGLKVVTADAIKWIERFKGSSSQGRKKYDLVIVDLYLGKDFPQKATSENFMKSLKKLMSKDGVVIFNRLRTDGWQVFEEKLRKVFSEVAMFKTSTNYFFVASG